MVTHIGTTTFMKYLILSNSTVYLTPLDLFHLSQKWIIYIATEFCKQVEQCSGSERSEFVSVMQRLLPMIYLKATMVEEVEEGIGYVDPAVTEEDYEYIRTQIAAIMRDADDYLDVFVESFRYSDAPVVCTVSESLADIYQALRNMIEAFRSEIDEAIEVALFDCLEDFKLRWGQLILGATRAIHELIASGQVDEL